VTYDEIKIVTRGQSDPEYATLIMQMCGIAEKWSRIDEPPYWISSQAELRRQLELTVKVIKDRVVSNLRFHAGARGAKERILRFLARRDDESLGDA
jgi:hypothetical protein